MEQNNSKGTPKTNNYHMKGGNGPYSYAHNSSYQKIWLDSEKDRMKELISEHLDVVDVENPLFSHNKSFKIADFGCSIGPNTFIAVNNIIAAIESNYESNDENLPEFLVFFNDNIGNDFNALFRNFPVSSRKYYAVGLPGSFHGRLLPNATLHLAHCSTALHWLSRIPKEVTDKESIAWNKGRIHYTGAVKEVYEAYSIQFGEDFNSFLNARAQELVPGGLMILTILGFPDGVQIEESDMGEITKILESCLEDLAKMGVIIDDMLESFNLPFYLPLPSQLKTLLDTNGLFDIKRIEKLPLPMNTENINPQLDVLHVRAVISEIIRQHFGEEILDDLFELLKKKCIENPIPSDKYRKEANYLVFLKRKTDKDP